MIVSWLLAGLVVMAIAIPATAATYEEGQAIFEQSCASCHTVDGSGTAIAPDLKGVTEKRDRDWLARWIAAPDEMLSEGDPLAQELLDKYNGIPMPNMGLSQSQVEAVLTYLAAQGGEMQPVTTSLQPVAESVEARGVAPQTGKAQIGKKLFTGEIAFQNRASACISCHAAGVGVLGGGTLGPDLTHVFGRYGKTGLSSVLETLPFPTMQGIYQDKLLTEEEQSNLLAFFEQANNQESGVEGLKNMLTPSWKFVLVGLGGFLVLALLSNFIWRDRFTGVRQPLVGDSKQ